MKLACSLVGFAIALALECAAQGPNSSASAAASTVQLTHVSNSFEFTAHAPQNIVAPLFGAHSERAWAEGWDPQFLYPQPPQDKAGVVFTVAHGGHTSTWITTVFEPEKGRIQYVYFIPGAMVTLIDIRLTPAGAADTRVQVTYERTALAPEMNDHVQQMGDSDRQSANHWQAALDNYLKKTAEGRKDQSK